MGNSRKGSKNNNQHKNQVVEKIKADIEPEKPTAEAVAGPSVEGTVVDNTTAVEAPVGTLAEDTSEIITAELTPAIEGSVEQSEVIAIVESTDSADTDNVEVPAVSHTSHEEHAAIVVDETITVDADATHDDLDALVESAIIEEEELLAEKPVFNTDAYDPNIELPNALRIIENYSSFNATIHPPKEMQRQNRMLCSALYSIFDLPEDQAVSQLRYAILIMRNAKAKHTFSAVGMGKEIQNLRLATGQRDEYESIVYILSVYVKVDNFSSLERAVNWEAFRTRARNINSERFTRILMKVAGISI